MTIALVQSSTSLQSIFTDRPGTRARIRDFFSSHIRNPNTRRAYMEAVRRFSGFCAEIGIAQKTRHTRSPHSLVNLWSPPSPSQNWPSRAR
jgi:hypothetical protein